jgi:hypothetical protein
MLEQATLNKPEKGGETIEDMFKRLPPHGKPNCVTHLLTNENIDEAMLVIQQAKELKVVKGQNYNSDF